MEVKQSAIGESFGPGLFTTVDVSEGAYVGIEQTILRVRFQSDTNKLIEGMKTPIFEPGVGTLYSYKKSYGEQNSPRVSMVGCYP